MTDSIFVKCVPGTTRYSVRITWTEGQVVPL